MLKTIILNNSEGPFSPLSPDYKDNLKIDNEVWPTLTNYILSHLIKTPMNKDIIRNAELIGSKKDINIDALIIERIKNTENTTNQKLKEHEKTKISESIIKEFDEKKLNINELLTKLHQQETNEITRSAVEKAYNAICSNDKIATYLRSTKNSPIHYVSNNEFLGIGQNGNGKNIIGKILVQIRYNLIRQYNEQKKDTFLKEKLDKIYNIYEAEKFLQHQINKGYDIKEFIGKDVYYINKNWKDKNILPANVATDRELITNMYKNKQFPFIDKELENPNSLALEIRNQNIDKLIDIVTTKRINIVFEEYTKYMMRKNFPDLSEKDIDNSYIQFHNQIQIFPTLTDNIKNQITQTGQNINFEKLNDMKNKVYKKYMENLGYEDLNKLIENKLNDFPVVIKDLVGLQHITITDEEKHDNASESSNDSSTSEDKISYNIKQQLKKQKSNTKFTTKLQNTWVIDPCQANEANEVKEENNEIVTGYIKPNGEILKIRTFPSDNNDYMSIYFSPIASIYFKIDKYIYPSVSLYISTRLIASTGITLNKKDDKTILEEGISIDNAYKMIKTDTGFNSADEANVKYYNSKKKTHILLAQEYAYKGYTVKFQDMSMSDLLVMTNEFKIEWNNRRDFLLGTGFPNKKEKPAEPGLNIISNTLMKLREEIVKKRKENKQWYQNNIMVSSKNIDIMMNDTFMKSWFLTRLNDMCKTVYRFVKYLEEVAKIDNPMSLKLVKTVLNTVYNNCNIVSQNYDIVKSIPPDSFLIAVRECPNMFQTDKYVELNEQIKLLQTNIENMDFDLFNSYKLKQQSTIEEQDFQKHIQKNKQLINEMFTMKDKQSYMKFKDMIQYKTLFLEIWNEKSKNDLAKSIINPRDKWVKEMEDIHSYEDISKENQEQIRQLQNKQKIEYDKAPSDKKQKYKELHKLEKIKLLKKLYIPKNSINEIREKIELLKRKQEQEQEQLKKKSQVPNDIWLKHIEEKKKASLELKELQKTRKDLGKTEYENTDILAFYYWKRIASMLELVIEKLININSNTPVINILEIKKIIVKSQLILSDNIECKRLIGKDGNIYDNEDNCIVSAILNLLHSIEQFKVLFAENVPLSIYDVNLAVAILLNKNIKEPIISEGDPDLFLPDFKQTLDIIPLEYNEENSDEDVDYEDVENSDDDKENNEDETESFFFTGKPRKEIPEEIGVITRYLSNIINKKYNTHVNIDDISKYIITMINHVKSYRMNKISKQNRVNFFATLK